MTFNLKERLILKTGALTKVFDCDLRPDSGWKIELAFMTKEGFERMMKKHNRRVFIQATNEHVQKLNKAEFFGEMADKIFVGWSGLTVEVLKTLVAFDSTGLKDDQEIEFSRETCVLILLHSVGFDAWVMEVASSPGRFQSSEPEQEEGALGNSSPSPSGG